MTHSITHSITHGMNSRIQQALRESLDEVEAGIIREGSLAANIHQAYNEWGVEQGGGAEKGKRLGMERVLVQSKNIYVAKGLVEYWTAFPKEHPEKSIVTSMQICADYKKNREHEVLEEAAYHTHDLWRRFVTQFEREKVQIGSISNPSRIFAQICLEYTYLREKEKDADRLVVSAVSKSILLRAKLLPERRA